MFEKYISEIEQKKLNVHGINIYQKGEVIFRRYFDENKRYPIYSATKSFLSAAVGIAEKENRLALNAPIYEYLTKAQQSLIPRNQLESFKLLTTERYLTMSVPSESFRPQGDNWLEYCLSQQVDYSAKPLFNYSNISAYMIAVACENAVGQKLYDYMNSRLFEPLGIDNPPYVTSPEGYFNGASGMELTLDELSRLGILLLQNGEYNQQQIVPEKYLQKASSYRLASSEYGYGYFFWVGKDSYSVSGKWGQKILIYPQKKLAVTYLSHLPEQSDEMLGIAKSIASFL
ncbi:MAG: serine hydrolase domain-containing protein [Oscillospiraceae bacterium]